jgi:hypothetical protein
MRDPRKLRFANSRGSYFYETFSFDDLNLAEFYDENSLRSILSELDIPNFRLPSLRQSLAVAEVRYEQAKIRDNAPSLEQRRSDLEILLKGVSRFGERNMQLWFDDREFVERYLSSKTSLRDSEPSCPKSEKFPQLAQCQILLETLDTAVRKAIERLPKQRAGRRRIGAVRAWCDELAAFWCYELGRKLTVYMHDNGEPLSPATIFFHRLLESRAPEELPRLPRALQGLRRKFPTERNPLSRKGISLSD